MPQKAQHTPAAPKNSPLPLVDASPRPAHTALTVTGGFLSGFTHTLQPYIGCRFSCEYCYVRTMPIHLFHKPRHEWGQYVHPRVGIDGILRRELERIASKNELDQLMIFMSSATDPYQGAERKWRLSRACLDVFNRYPPRLLVIQTRSPIVADDFDRLQSLGERCWLNFTIETDLDSVRRTVTPLCASTEKRFQTLEQAQAMGLNVEITVSPCLPYSSPTTFGERLIACAQRVIVDTYSGDGANGHRTAHTDIPHIYLKSGWGHWDDQKAARALYKWLRNRMGDRVSWSQDGFTALTREGTSCHL